MFSSSALAFFAIVSIFGVGMCKITTVSFPNYEELLGEFKVGDLGCNGASPESPDEIGVTFELFTDGTQGELLDWTNYQSVLNSNFNPNLRTKFIIHGWRDKMSGQKWTDMRDALLNLAEPLNVICVDWSPGADKMWYMTSRDNTRVVGRIVGKLIHMLVRDAGARYKDMHVIGHSLGAHIAGYAGEECGGLIGRISGLDPAGPLFEHTERACKLDETDALFVDSMHTDGELIIGGGAGLMERCATHDWYPFGGKDQPDCKSSFFGKFDVACDHIMAVTYYTASINGKSFAGSKRAETVQDLLKDPVTCANGVQDCPQMGYFDSDEPRYSDGCYLMETRM